jgi:16S rRNA (cytosine967-C5)-methyltransferase
MSLRAVEFAPGMGARAVAHRALSETLRRKRPLDAVLDQSLDAQNLSARDRGFARVIASETMRRMGQLDDLLRRFVPRAPPPHRAGTTLEILLAGACELLFLNVPAHAAVDGANRLAAADTKAVHFKPLINATLRRLARDGPAIVEEQDALRLNTPDWLWMRWLETYGEETTHAMTRVHSLTPPLDLFFAFPLAGEVPPRVRPKAGPRINSGRRGDVCVSQPPSGASHHHPRERGWKELPGGMMRLDHAGNVESLPGFAEGEFWVQDFAASLPVRLFGDLRGHSAIDLCAAPGGKTAQLVCGGAEVTCVERDADRLARLSANLERLKFHARLECADVRDFQPDAPAACVLLDAPCSATGTIRRHPELPWIKSAGDVSACADAAAELLDAAASMVAPGGRLVFAVCSLEREEGEEQIAHFLRRNGGFARLPVAAEEIFGLAECVSEAGDLRTLPCHFAALGGMDGFYAARLVRL